MFEKLKAQIASPHLLAVLTVVFLLGILSDELLRMIAASLTDAPLLASHQKLVNAPGDQAPTGDRSPSSGLLADQTPHSSFSSIFELDTQTPLHDDPPASSSIDAAALAAIESNMRSLDGFKSFKLDTALVLRPGSPEQLSLYELCRTSVQNLLTDKTMGTPPPDISFQPPSQWITLLLPKERLYAVFTVAHDNNHPRQLACVLDLNKKLKSTRILPIPQNQTSPQNIFTIYAHHLLNNHPHRVLY